MNIKTNTNLVRSLLALTFALALWSPVQMQAAEPAAGKMMTEGKMKECCEAMKDQKEKLMAEMKAQDAELAAQVTAMDNAPDDKKLGLMAAIVTHLVEQRSAMNARMEKMHGQMMGHMMQHMQMGKESMSQCPMMEGMKNMDEKSPTSQEDHHDQQK
jgi:hypothetical protein